MCGCSQNKVVIAPLQQTVVVDENCNVTLEDIKRVREVLIGMKTPENFSYINVRLGELQTMENTGKYCQYPL